LRARRCSGIPRFREGSLQPRAKRERGWTQRRGGSPSYPIWGPPGGGLVDRIEFSIPAATPAERERWEPLAPDVTGFLAALPIPQWNLYLRVMIYRNHLKRETPKNFQLDLFTPDDGHFTALAIGTRRGQSLKAVEGLAGWHRRVIAAICVRIRLLGGWMSQIEGWGRRWPAGRFLAQRSVAERPGSPETLRQAEQVSRSTAGMRCG
jgi:hypothetical protein